MNQLALDPQPVLGYRIPLTRGMFALVDVEDYERLSRYKWRARWHKDTRTFYAIAGDRGVIIHMAREVMSAPNGLVVDHRNHDTLDNRKSNLRLATSNQNQWNRHKNVNNTSGFKGVHRLAPRRFTAHVRFNGKKIHLGYFDTAEEAHARYVEAASYYHGEFFVA